MRLNTVPFNVWLLRVTPELLRSMRPTTTGEIFETGTNNLNKDGLFSVETFGPLGSKERDKRFSYIELHTSIFHPLILKRLGTLKRLYLDIISGKRYALWNAEAKDFVPSDPIEGETGFAFFMKHFPELVFTPGDSSVRNMRIQLIDKNRENATTKHVLVMPAGLRDIQVDPNGRTSEDEINSFYRSIIATSNSISITETSRNDPVLNVPRMALQNAFSQLYDMVFNFIDGKGGMALGKWASRKVRNGTANVISPMIVTTNRLGAKDSPGIDDIQMGIFQGVKSVLPQTIYFLRTGWLGKKFGGEAGSDVFLTNAKTLRAERVSISVEDFERFSTREGLEALVNKLAKKEYRQRPIRIDGYYLGLVYVGPQGFKVFSDIEELPQGFDKEKVYPLNLTTLIYLSGYRHWHEFSGVSTRYPVAGDGSTLVAYMRMLTTTTSYVVPELGDDWKRLGDDFVASAFPDQSPDATFIETLSPHLANLKGLTADHDGDRMTWTATYSHEANAEFAKLRRQKEWFVHVDGRLKRTAVVDNVELLLSNITG